MNEGRNECASCENPFAFSPNWQQFCSCFPFSLHSASKYLKWKSNCFELLEEKPFQKLRQPAAVADTKGQVGKAGKLGKCGC